MSADIATISSQVDELLTFKEDNEDVLEGIVSNGSGGFQADSGDITGALNVGSLTCDTLTVTGSTGNSQFIINADILQSNIIESSIIGKGVSGTVPTGDTSYFKIINFTPTILGQTNSLTIKNIDSPTIEFNSLLNLNHMNSIDFYKNRIIYDRILSTDTYFRLFSKNNIELKSDKELDLFSKNMIKLSLDKFDKNIQLLNPVHITCNINNTLNNNSLVVEGGVSVKKDMIIGGNISVENFNSDGSLICHDILVKKDITINTNCNVNNDIIIKGNLSIDNPNSGKSIINSQLLITNEKESINKDTGSVILSGGLSVKKNLNVNNSLYVSKDVEFLSNLNITSKVGIGTTEPLCSLHIESDNAIILPVGGDETRPNPPMMGMMRFNSLSGLEGYDGTVWTSLGGVRNADGTTQIYVDESDDIYFKTNDKINAVLSDGKFGLGSDLKTDTYPSETLHIKGNLKLEGLLLLSEQATQKTFVGKPTKTFDTKNDSIDITPNTTIADAFYNVEQYILDYISGHPPKPILINQEVSGYSININFLKPVQYTFGFTDKILPELINLNFSYKLSSDDTYTDISIDNVDINNVQFVLDNASNYNENNTYYIFIGNIRDTYDFRIFYSNYKSTSDPANRDYNFLNILNINFPPIGEPNNPTNLLSTDATDTSITITFDKPTDHDMLNEEIQVLPLIKNYKVTYNSISTSRNNSFILHELFDISVIGNINNNAIPEHTINNLNPGHTYRIKVQSLNRVNPTYSEFSIPIDISTIAPQPPPNYVNGVNNLNIDNTNSIIYLNNGSLLNTTLNNLIIINNNIANNIIETNTLNNIRLNYSTDSNDTQQDDNITNFIINFDRHDTHNINIFGFNSNTNDNLSTNVHTIFSNEGDFHTESNKTGFYKTIDIKLKNVNIIPRLEPYYFNIYQVPLNDSNTYNSNEIKFYVDNLNNLPEISNLSINTINNSQTINISGITVFLDNTIFDLSFTIKYLASYFTRSDYKYTDLYLSDNNGNIFSTLYELKTNDSNITTNPNIINHIPPLADNINISAQITLILVSTLYTSNLKLKALPYNLFGIGQEVIDNTNSKLILVDFNSKQTLDNISNNNNIYGYQVTSGSGLYPIFGTSNNNFGLIYNHDDSILNTEELQLINGFFTTPINNYIDYSNYFQNTLDYTSIISNTDYRHVTFKYIISDISTKTDESINLVKIELIGNNFNNILENDIQLLIKIHNTDNLSNLNTIWISGNNPVNALGINLNNSSQNSNNHGIAGLSTSGNYISTNIIKFVYLPQGSKGNLYIRLSLRNDSNKKIKYIKVSES